MQCKHLILTLIISLVYACISVGKHQWVNMLCGVILRKMFKSLMPKSFNYTIETFNFKCSIDHVILMFHFMVSILLFVINYFQVILENFGLFCFAVVMSWFSFVQTTMFSLHMALCGCIFESSFSFHFVCEFICFLWHV